MKNKQLRAICGQLENRAIVMGAQFFGVADLTEALETIVEQGGDFLAAFPRSIILEIFYFHYYRISISPEHRYL